MPMQLGAFSGQRFTVRLLRAPVACFALLILVHTVL